MRKWVIAPGRTVRLALAGVALGVVAVFVYTPRWVTLTAKVSCALPPTGKPGTDQVMVWPTTLIVPLEAALDLGWQIMAACFEPAETGISSKLTEKFWPKKTA